MVHKQNSVERSPTQHMPAELSWINIRRNDHCWPMLSVQFPLEQIYFFHANFVQNMRNVRFFVIYENLDFNHKTTKSTVITVHSIG